MHLSLKVKSSVGIGSTLSSNVGAGSSEITEILNIDSVLGLVTLISVMDNLLIPFGEIDGGLFESSGALTLPVLTVVKVTPATATTGSSASNEGGVCKSFHSKSIY